LIPRPHPSRRSESQSEESDHSGNVAAQRKVPIVRIGGGWTDPKKATAGIAKMFLPCCSHSKGQTQPGTNRLGLQRHSPVPIACDYARKTLSRQRLAFVLATGWLAHGTTAALQPRDECGQWKTARAGARPCCAASGRFSSLIARLLQGLHGGLPSPDRSVCTRIVTNLFAFLETSRRCHPRKA